MVELTARHGVVYARCAAALRAAGAPAYECTFYMMLVVVAEFVETQRRTGNTVQRAMHVAHALAAQVSSTMHSPRSFRPCVCGGGGAKVVSGQAAMYLALAARPS